VAMTIAGRIIPSFTAAAIPGLVAVVTPRRERIVFVASLLAFGASALGLPGAAVALAAFAAAVAHLWRMSGWNSLATRHSPILWILHLSYAWVPAGFALLGLAGLGLVSPIASYHAFGIGVVAGLIIGMMTRTARGHTGRPLRVGAAETMAYVMVHLAALIRLAPLLGLNRRYGECLLLSGLLFAAAFLIYLVVYLPFLLRPRLDGKPG
ncbi:MAG: NnrS family protein, partial [Pseudomonadota bacterium]|nr:NnrS family protein [Pseudomonadota bacterium]